MIDAPSPNPAILAALRTDLAELSLGDRLARFVAHPGGRVVFTTSFCLEDQALVHIIAERQFMIEIVTLDTGRLFPETYDLWAETEARYGVTIKGFVPEAAQVEALTAATGINGFRGSIDARKACCGVRKLGPLTRALRDAAGWFTGLRAEQSSHRAATPLVEFDAGHGLFKVNPLSDWTRQQLVDFIAIERIPYNPLYDRGFPSIGCAPCTRAVRIGEDERAGRWWWEADAKRECGLHVAAGSESESPA